jgi:hypothetical protein
MKIEKHVTNLELSKKLFELDIPQESVWGLHWVLSEFSVVGGTEFKNTMVLTHEAIGTKSKTKYKAFLASEIIERLPNKIILPEAEPFNCFRFQLYSSIVVEDTNIVIPTYIVNYICDTFETTGESAFLERKLFNNNIWDKTLPDALAKTLIHVREENLFN